MYSSLRYLLPVLASGDPWSSRLAKMLMCGRGVVEGGREVVLRWEREGRAWMGDGSGYKMGWRGIPLKGGGSWMCTLPLILEGGTNMVSGTRDGVM